MFWVKTSINKNNSNSLMITNMELRFEPCVLTPKGLNVRTADKPVLVSVTWAHTIFGFFETFCEHASRTKLREKTKIVFFGPTDQKL
jgi:hypothetical protein